jgi:cephalosporin-C deacetylase
MTKQLLYITVALLSACSTVFAVSSKKEAELTGSNIIPYEWKIAKDTACQLTNSKVDISNWSSINLGVSWERQGYFYANGKLILANYFVVPDLKVNLADQPFQLVVNLQCKVLELFVNGEKIVGELTFKGSPTLISIPANKLLLHGKNLIAIRISNVQWTGGACKNVCRLSHPAYGFSGSLSVKTSVAQNLYTNDQDIKLAVDYNRNKLKPAKLKIKVISDFFKNVENKNIVLNKQNGPLTVQLNRKLYKPGFYHVFAYTDEPFFDQSDIWIAVEPEKISCPAGKIPDLQGWWDATKRELNAIPPETKITKISNQSDFKDIYEVEFTSLENIKVYGYMFVPKKEGKFPAILHVPGYGVGYTPRSFNRNQEDVIEFGVAIRGQSPSNKVIRPGFDLLGLVSYKICDPKTYVYRGAYMDCLRALDILRSFSKTDTSKVAVMGGSQGGGLSLATAALAGSKVKACVTLCPFLCDLEHHGVVRPVFLQEKQAFSKAYNCTMETINNTLEYVDTKNMATWITSPVFFGSALFDDDCPSHVGFVTFNKISTPKKFKLYPNDGHMVLTNQADQDGRAFLKEIFGY